MPGTRILVAALVATAFLFTARASYAQDAVDRTAGQLKSGDDFRVRTQAALALGASKSKRAVDPLCKGLDDSSQTVRAASAAALGKLKQGGEDCLSKRLDNESNEMVKSSIKKALSQMGSSGGSNGPALSSNTKVYIALAKVVDKNGKTNGDMDSAVRKAMSKAAGNLDGFVIAPPTETKAEAKTRLAKFKKVKGYYLAAKVFEPVYSSRGLQIKIDVTFFTYPDKVMKGNVPVKLTQEGVTSKDAASEEELIRMAAERAIEKFSQNVDRIQD